jgi:predicted N-acetyltransferase YhbS
LQTTFTGLFTGAEWKKDKKEMSNMSEIITAQNKDKQDIVDFINYVFSVAYTAHDYKKKLPKVYADDAKEDAATHYIIKKDGKIKAIVSIRTIFVSICGKILKYGLIGNVAVHPYSRGEGYMRELMDRVIEKAKSDGIDLLALTGQRQRYGYFGFSPAGICLRYTITDTNVRHALKDIDCSCISFLPLEKANDEQIDTVSKLYEKRPAFTLRERDEYIDIMSSWESKTNLILSGDKTVGYIYGAMREVVLENEDLLYPVIKAYFDINGTEKAEISVQPFEKRRAEMLAAICEARNIQPTSLIKVLNWERVLSAFTELKAKCSSLENSEKVVDIEGEILKLSIKSEKFRVQKALSTEKAEISLTESEAHELFFGIEGLMGGNCGMKSFGALPFMLDTPDTF